MRSRVAILLGVVFVVAGISLFSWPFVRARLHLGSFQPLAFKDYVNPQSGVVETYYLTIEPSKPSMTANVEGVATVYLICSCEARRDWNLDPSDGAELMAGSGCVTDVSFVCNTNPSASFWEYSVPTGSYDPQWLKAELCIGTWTITATPQDDRHPVASCSVTVNPATPEQYPPVPPVAGNAVRPLQYSTLFGGIFLAAGVGSIAYGLVFRG